MELLCGIFVYRRPQFSYTCRQAGRISGVFPCTGGRSSVMHVICPSVSGYRLKMTGQVKLFELYKK